MYVYILTSSVVTLTQTIITYQSEFCHNKIVHTKHEVIHPLRIYILYYPVLCGRFVLLKVESKGGWVRCGIRAGWLTNNVNSLHTNSGATCCFLTCTRTINNWTSWLGRKWVGEGCLHWWASIKMEREIIDSAIILHFLLTCFFHQYK